MRRVQVALAAALTVIAIALGLVLSRPPLTFAGSNGVPANFAIAFIGGNQVICQPGGTVPAGTEAIRVSLSVNTGPSVRVRVLSGSTVVTEGAHSVGWGVDETVTMPVRRVPRTIAGASICTTIGPAVEPIQVNGAKAPSSNGGPGVWLRLVPSVARDMGIAHAPAGTWVAYLTIAVMLAVCALVSRSVLRELR
jgi:hypothetical protein